MIQGKNHASPDRKAAVKALHRTRPRSRLLRATLYVLAAVVAYSWLLGGLSGFDLFTARRARNLQRFFHEATPFPLQDRSFDAGVLFGWIRDLLAESGWHAALVTVAIASAATVLAGVLGWIAAGPAARVLATPDPYLESRKSTPLQRGLWRSLVVATRGFLIVLRAIPEYVWAFLLLAILGPGAWPAVLALGLHNAGILGRLQAEVIENSDHAPFAAARAAGATRRQLAAFVVPPLTTGRYLLYLFYRWETCVREATVLGILGIPTLGYFVIDARARQQLDTMLFFVLLASVLVVLGDLASYLARDTVRRAR